MHKRIQVVYFVLSDELHWHFYAMLAGSYLAPCSGKVVKFCSRELFEALV